MAKLTRKTAKIFGETATATGSDPEIGQFGSAKAGTYVGTGDIDTIQGLSAWSNGWIDAVTPDQQFPTLPEMTGVHKVLSYQTAYLLQQGVAEWDSATTYYSGNFCALNNIIYYSLTDNNTNNNPSTDTVNWMAYDSLPSQTGNSGKFLTTDGFNASWVDFTGANVDLTNLTSFGNGKFQFAPFSINAGAIDANGDNETLTTSGGTPISVDTYIIPELSANTTQYGTCTNYLFTTQNVIATATNINWSMNFSADNYIPAGATISFTLNIGRSAVDELSGIVRYGSNRGCKVTYVYTDDSEEVAYDSAVSGYKTPTNTWILYTFNATNAPTKTVKGVSVIVYIADNYHCMGGKFTLTAQYNVSTSDTLISQPCTITTADSRSKTFDANNILDCSTTSDGTYKVMKDIEYGSLSLASTLYIQKTEPQAQVEAVFTQPVLTADGTLGGAEFAVAADNGNAWVAFDGTNSFWESTGSPSYLIFYNPNALNVTKLTITNDAAYQPSAGQILGSNDNSNWDTITSFTNNNSTSGATWDIDLSANTSFYKYYKINVTAHFNNTYTRIRELAITATYLQGSTFFNGDLWLDNSKYPLTLKQYDSSESEWVVNNDLVYIGDVTVGSGYITAITNRYFNACPVIRLLVDSYQNSISGYDIYSDGYCVQRGACTSGTAVVLLKAYSSGNYALSVPYSAKSASDFTPSATGNWITQGYLE